MRVTILMAVLLIVGALAYALFWFDRGDSSLDPGEAQFALADTGAVHRIVMTGFRGGRSTQRIDLVRTANGDWQLNGQYPALRPRVQHLLKVMNQLAIREVLNEAGQHNANRFFEVMRTEVQVMDQAGNTLKHYLVGSETPDARGTLMRMIDVETPYVVEMPGLQGYVKASYAMDPLVWRANRLFLADTSRLVQVAVEFTHQPDASWTLLRDASGSWTLEGAAVDSTRFADWLTRWQRMVYAETFAEADFPGRKQQLASQRPDARVVATYRDGHTRELLLFDRPDNPNNLFGWVVGEDELLTIQHFVIDPYLPAKGYLTSELDDRQPPWGEVSKALPTKP